MLVGITAALALVAGTQAAQVSVTGALATNAGAAGTLATNSNTAINFSASAGGASVMGLVQATSTVIGDIQIMTLVLTNFNYSSNANGSITVVVSQDYAIGAPVASATGSHQFNGNTTGTRNGNLVVNSAHEATALPQISNSFAGPANPFGAQQGATTNVGVIGNVYSILATYVFTFNGGTATGSVILPDSGVDNATLVLVPLPPAAYAGIGGLALVGLVAGIRRRKHAS